MQSWAGDAVRILSGSIVIYVREEGENSWYGFRRRNFCKSQIVMKLILVWCLLLLLLFWFLSISILVLWVPMLEEYTYDILLYLRRMIRRTIYYYYTTILLYLRVVWKMFVPSL